MNKTLLKSVREYKKQSFLTPLFVILEVFMEVLIPLEMDTPPPMKTARRGNAPRF